MNRQVFIVKLVLIAVCASFVGAFLGGVGAYHPASGKIAGAFSGAVTGAGYTFFMQKMNRGRLMLFLAGIAAGSICGLFSGFAAHLPSYIMGIRHGGSFLAVPMSVGTIFGLCTGITLGGFLSFFFETREKSAK